MPELKPNKTNELLKQIQKGSPFAFQALFDNYSRKIYHFSMGYLKNKQEAEDIVQEVFLKIWKSREELLTGTSFESFLFTITRNAILNTIRKEKYQQVYMNYVKLHLGKNVLLDEELDFNELERAYKKSIDKLPPRRKEIFLLSRYENISNVEIAKKMDVSVKTVENQMTSALADIRQNLLKLGFSGIIFFEIFL
ncbi:RNA polymerase sigma-70 factor [Maribellus sp. CM-23]|uniref:RNA polymerase sigma-70 factor n=1 Tax=Maribellus sp. CM-23 TaxID=2781026 RepID=UPI001F23D57D|nr:RNA polymerase sigma-70 factor [Maribellus sp. CM-23]MCE4564753.1 RNA polymerase sigma-70 factor [Maribellus sp. CM-23]